MGSSRCDSPRNLITEKALSLKLVRNHKSAHFYYFKLSWKLKWKRKNGELMNIQAFVPNPLQDFELQSWDFLKSNCKDFYADHNASLQSNFTSSNERRYKAWTWWKVKSHLGELIKVVNHVNFEIIYPFTDVVSFLTRLQDKASSEDISSRIELSRLSCLSQIGFHSKTELTILFKGKPQMSTAEQCLKRRA